MADAVKAKKIFKAARDWYESAHKSENKGYGEDPDNQNPGNVKVSMWVQIAGKAIHRNEEIGKAADQMRALEGHEKAMAAMRGAAVVSALDHGMWLARAKEGERAGNCWDLACLSLYIAHARESVPKDELAVGGIFTPDGVPGKKADHAFALYGDSTLIAALIKHPRALAAVEPGAARRATPVLKQNVNANAQVLRGLIYAIDPWMNLWCALKDYPHEAARKMKKWSSCGKRVRWMHGGDDWEWCDPGGEYLESFANAWLSATGPDTEYSRAREIA